MPPTCRVLGTSLWFLPVTTRVPLKFGTEALTSVTCARVRVTVAGPDGTRAEGWGETPLSVQWVWPSTASLAVRHSTLLLFCQILSRAWAHFGDTAHPLVLGHTFNEQLLPRLRDDFNASGLAPAGDPLPQLAALVCNSAFDLAVHDAFGRLLGLPAYQTYSPEILASRLDQFLEPASNHPADFRGRSLSGFLLPAPRTALEAWHLVGGLDPLSPDELTGSEPLDGHPVLLADWIRRDGLHCLKIKLRGNDADWDLRRMIDVGQLSLPMGVRHLTADFNCTVRDPAYVCGILDQLETDHPDIHAALLYVEQPFPYDLEANPIEVHAVSRRKPLYLDESAHDWRLVRLGRQLGWTGVALKTCKTQSGALLSAAWAQAHGMELMVQDLTNPMLAQIPHVQLAAHLPTRMGVETNAMQFYPAASEPESRIHPGLYSRRDGELDLRTLAGPGFGYRGAETVRILGEPVSRFGEG
jgi:L-alanine-DL-glutamate epimerase-like enolase superfamily enzyme